MSRMESACNRNGVASEHATSPASRASEVHMPSATKRAFNKPAQPPARYDKTAVVLLGWEPDYCDTGVAPELASLANVLQEKYNFVVESHLMHTRTAPQRQAFKHLSNFVDTYDNPQTLLVVYYAGHGYQSLTGPGYLALSGKPIYHRDAMVAASIEWHEVERTLVATSSDVLVIFDCCRAGLLCKSAQEGLENNDRIFQCLGACESDQRTRSSGKQSFTTAMIWALEELAEESSFPVTKLVKKIEAHVGFPHNDQRPVLFGGRFAAASEIICLSRMRRPTLHREPSVVANSTTENMTGTGSGAVISLAWSFPGAKVMRSAATLANLLRHKILGQSAVTYIANCALTLAVAQRWNDFLRTAGRTSHTADHQRDAGRSRSGVQNDCS